MLRHFLILLLVINIFNTHNTLNSPYLQKSILIFRILTNNLCIAAKFDFNGKTYFTEIYNLT